jgi:hypothetical protein
MDYMTEELFTYAGHTQRVRIFADASYATDEEPIGLTFETESVRAVELIEDGENLGIYPKHFAEYESADYIVNEFVGDKESAQTFAKMEELIRRHVATLIKHGIFGAVN